MSRITLRDVAKSFGAVKILHGIDLDIAEGELVVFVGPSGCGKSTLLRLIAGLDKPTSGTISHRRASSSTTSPAADRGLAMVFQSYALYPHMSVRQNMAFGLENAGMARPEIDRRIDEAARMLDIQALLKRRPGQLSGGQRQRVAIGRAIVRNPTAFLLDEPLSNLDAELRISTRAELAALHERLATTMIYVTHDQTEAMTLADRIVVLRAGRVEQVGSPLELYNRPANRFVAGFIGAPSMNFLDATLVRDGGRWRAALAGGETLPLELADIAGPADGSEVVVGIRPQHIEMAGAAADAPAAIGAAVQLVEALGAETVLHTRTADGTRLLAVLQGQHDLATDAPVRLVLPPARLHVFGADGLRLSPAVRGA